MRKNLFKIFIITGLMLVVVGGAKIVNNQLVKADASVNSSPICGVNSGFIWNGSGCVNTCDQNHPWDKVAGQCSGNWYNQGTNPNQVVNPNCQAFYGSNYYFNGQKCIQIQTLPNANYYGNPYNGGVTQPVYGTINYNNLATPNTQNPNSGVQINWSNVNNNQTNSANNYYQNTNYNVPNSNQNPTYNPCDYNCYSDNNQGSSVKDYYTITVTTSTYSGGTPIYLGSNTNYNSNYNTNTNYYGNNYNNNSGNSGNYYNNSYNQNTNYNYNQNSNSDGYPSWEDFQDGNYLNYSWYSNNYN